MNSLKLSYISFGLILTSMLGSGCSKHETSFTQMPGFKEHFTNNKPSEALPSKSDQALLSKFRPRVYMAKNQTPMIDFYADYIASGSFYIDGKLISKKVDQALLNKHKDNVQAEFRHSPQKQQGSPTVFARIHQEELIYKDQNFPLTFLSYNLVFANSGLVKGLASWQRLAMGIVGDNNDWHQLDHYVGLTIALSNQRPIAVMLQQHNYQTTWLLTDKNIDKSTNKSTDKSTNINAENILQMPKDGRIAVDVAMQSNELYLHSSKQKKHPGISFIKADSLEFLITGKNKPIMAGWDITHGEIEQEYTLKFLPPSDAFYTFKGKLGESRKLPGRDGPPGADYATIPGLMPLADRLVSAYRPKDLATETKKLNILFGEKYSIKSEGLLEYKKDFIGDLKSIKK